MEYNKIKKVGLLGSHGWSATMPKKERRRIYAKIIEKKSKYNELVSALNWQKNQGRRRPETIEAIKSDIHHVKSKYGHLSKPIQIKSIKKYNKEFESKAELECYEYLKHKKIHFQFQKKIKGKRIDFFLRDKVFIEYHPMNPMFDKTLDRNEYLSKRKKALSGTKYQNFVLLHATSFEEFKKYADSIDSHINKPKAISRIKNLIYQKKIKNKNDLHRFKTIICNEERSVVMKDKEILDTLNPKWNDLFKK